MDVVKKDMKAPESGVEDAEERGANTSNQSCSKVGNTAATKEMLMLILFDKSEYGERPLCRQRRWQDDWLPDADVPDATEPAATPSQTGRSRAGLGPL